MKYKALGGLLTAVIFVLPLAAQPGLFLKTPLKTPESGARQAALEAKRLNAKRWHWLAVYQNPPGQVDLATLESRGATVVMFVPARGVVAAAESEFVFNGLGLEWLGRISPEQKISPLLQGTEQIVLVEFYADITRTEIGAIVATEGYSLEEHPDLLNWQAMIRIPAGALLSLASWDEVSYVFPASYDLAMRNPVDSCPGAITDTARVGQVVDRAGEGWDGPGKGSFDLGYYFSTYTGRLSQTIAKQEVLRAMAEWSRVVKVNFSPAISATQRASINIQFASWDHGDGFPFDGPGRVLAHTFYPANPNPEPIAGDLHFDDDETWSAGGSLDLFSVALHELGHALGLGHSDNPSAVMYPYYRKAEKLTDEDINAIQQMYAANNAGQPPLTVTLTTPASATVSTEASSITITGSSTGGAGTGQVTWTNERGGNGTATGFRPWRITTNLQTGENVIFITAIDSNQERAMLPLKVTRTAAPASDPMTIRILTPASGSKTPDTSIVLTGTAGPAGTVDKITWVNGANGGGSGSFAAAWTTPPILLERGVNSIIVSAVDKSGKSVSAGIVIESVKPATTPETGPDRTAPTLNVTSPASSSFATTNTVFTITGTASDNVGVKDITWTSSANRNGTAIGTENWRIDVPLALGANTIMIKAADGAGNFSWRALNITRQ